MKPLAYVLLTAAVLVACGQRGDDPSEVQSREGEVVVESGSPAIGPQGTLVEAVGLETLGGTFTPVLEEGCVLPCEVVEIFSTAADHQAQIGLTLYSGQARLVRDARLLGRFKVTGFAPALRRQPQVEVRIVARGGDLLVLARDRKTGEALRVERLEEEPGSTEVSVGQDSL